MLSSFLLQIFSVALSTKPSFFLAIFSTLDFFFRLIILWFWTLQGHVLYTEVEIQLF